MRDQDWGCSQIEQLDNCPAATLGRPTATVHPGVAAGREGGLPVSGLTSEGCLRPAVLLLSTSAAGVYSAPLLLLKCLLMGRHLLPPGWRLSGRDDKQARRGDLAPPPPPAAWLSAVWQG